MAVTVEVAETVEVAVMVSTSVVLLVFVRVVVSVSVTVPVTVAIGPVILPGAPEILSVSVVVEAGQLLLVVDDAATDIEFDFEVVVVAAAVDDEL